MPTFDRSEEYDFEEAARHNAELERREQTEEAGAGGRLNKPKDRKRKDKKAINWTMVDREVFDVLVQLANEQGMILNKFCALVFSEVARDPDKILGSPMYRTSVMEYRAKRYYESLEALELTISEYIQHPTPQMADNITKRCDELGVDFDEIQKRIKSEPMRESLAEFRSDPDTKTARCEKWLRQLMKDNSYRIAARAGNIAGTAEGFHRDMTGNARKHLGVVSAQEGDDRQFYWTWPTNNRMARVILEQDDNDNGQD